MNRDKKPLYRKDNKTPWGYHGNTGDDFKNIRHTKKMKNFEGNHMGMKSGKSRGLDYTPLYKFLLSNIGKDWNGVHKEAVSRLDKQEPIFHLVALHEHEKRDFVYCGESSIWSGLYVDENNKLQKVNPNYTINNVYPTCTCCTFTFNGKTITNKYENNPEFKNKSNSSSLSRVEAEFIDDDGNEIFNY